MVAITAWAALPRSIPTSATVIRAHLPCPSGLSFKANPNRSFLPGKAAKLFHCGIASAAPHNASVVCRHGIRFSLWTDQSRYCTRSRGSTRFPFTIRLPPDTSASRRKQTMEPTPPLRVYVSRGPCARGTLTTIWQVERTGIAPQRCCDSRLR